MSFISAVLTAAVVNNYVLAKGFGFSSALALSKNKDYLKFFLCLAVDMIAVAVISWALGGVLVNFGFLTVLVNAVVVAVVAYATDKFVNKTSYNLFLFLALNTAIFALAMNVQGLEVVECLIQTIAACLAFALATLVFAGLASRLNNKNVPAAFKGLPIEVLAAAIISLALYAFK